MRWGEEWMMSPAQVCAEEPTATACHTVLVPPTKAHMTVCSSPARARPTWNARGPWPSEAGRGPHSRLVV
jgi:hypothetical protein